MTITLITLYLHLIPPVSCGALHGHYHRPVVVRAAAALLQPCIINRYIGTLTHHHPQVVAVSYQ